MPPLAGALHEAAVCAGRCRRACAVQAGMTMGAHMQAAAAEAGGLRRGWAACTQRALHRH